LWPALALFSNIFLLQRWYLLRSIFTAMCHFVVIPLFGNSHAGLLPNSNKSTDCAACSTAKPSDAYSEPIIHDALPPPPLAVNSLAIWHRKMNCAPKK
jgi:hypothetical protein